MATEEETQDSSITNSVSGILDLLEDEETDSDVADDYDLVFQDGKWVRVTKSSEHQIPDEVDELDNDIRAIERSEESDTPESRIEWVLKDGKWIPLQIGKEDLGESKIKEPSLDFNGVLKQKVPERFDFDQIHSGQILARVIKIPVDRLVSGDPRYNIVIKPGDSIQVPVDIIGEFVIGGNVNRNGAIPLTGRPITLKMAIYLAGGLGPLAWPKKCEVIRRIGKNKEEIVMVDLDKIASGEQPDFFIKPLDTINVGTHPTARWRAVLRNAFRATYGFGFLYDRNFADRDYGTSRPFSF